MFRIILKTIGSVVGLVLAIITLMWGFQLGRFAPVEIPPSPRQIISQENLRCLALEMNDTGETDAQRAYAFFANANVAEKTGLSNCTVYLRCLIILAPGQTTSSCTGWRTIPGAEEMAKRLESPELASSIVLRDQIAKDQGAYIALNPKLVGLTCVDKINRSKEPTFRWSGTDKKKMREELGKPIFTEKVPGSADPFEAFCSSLKPNASSLWPPGGKPPGDFFI